MNDVVIVQTSQGLAHYVTASNGGDASKLSVVIGHDARHNSARWARLAAGAFRRLGFTVFLLDWFKESTGWNVPFLMAAFYLFVL